MTFIAVRCPYCHSDQVVKRGKTRRGTQRYLCHNTACTPQSFLLEYRYQGRLPEVQQQIIDMSLNASGVRDTARVLRISTDTVLRALKKKEAALAACRRERFDHRLRRIVHLAHEPKIPNRRLRSNPQFHCHVARMSAA
jgi:transposase-like protein